jgi:single-strand DNA-binding protein
MNKATLIGRLAADPELRQTGSGIAVTSFTIAVDRPYTKGSDRQTDWIDIVAWRNTAEFVCKYFQKGSPIVVEGSIQTRMWEDKAGQKRKSVEIVAENVEFVPRSKDAGAPSFHTERNEFAPPIAEPAPVVYSAGSADDFTVVDDEDLPF